MSTQRYTILTAVQPPNPRRDPVVVYQCGNCGSAVTSMEVHDRWHERMELAVKNLAKAINISLA